MQLFYNPHINHTLSQFSFDKIESRHIVKVLRKTEGDILYITDGKGTLFTAEITLASDKKCVVQIVSKEKKQKHWDYYLHVVIAPTKNNDRFEWFLEKATEIGIDEITPILCKHSERKIIKKERLEKVLISAMKQSLKFQLPKFNDLISFSDFMKQSNDGSLFIAHCEKTTKRSFKEELKPNQKITVFIGPEGDFSTKEIETALKNNFSPVSLGNSRLRTETAGIVAVQSVAFYNESI